MAFTWKLAWRNIFRNRRRTIIASIAIGIGLASLIFSDAFIIGMKDSLIRSTTSSFMGEAQIHHEDYLLSREPEMTIRDSARVRQLLDQDVSVSHFSSRAMAFGMITSPANVNPVMLVGVNPEKEKHLSQFDDVLREGEWFSGDNPRDLVVGSKLAENLEVGLGDRVVITVSQVNSGDLSQEMFRVSAIYHFGIRELDSGMALIRLPRAQAMLGIQDGIHEIAVRFRDIQDAENQALPFWSTFSSSGNRASGWPELLPDMKRMLDMTRVSMMVLALILGVVVVFGIINTLFMSLYERMFEFGVLRAVGTRASKTRLLVVFEAVALGLVSAFIGGVLGLLLTGLVSHTGIDYRGIEMTGIHIQEIIYPRLQLRQFLEYPLWVVGFCALVGLYPARVAGRMKIAAALRKSL